MPRIQPDAFVAACPSRELLARLGEKWAMLALVALDEGPMRFGALRRRLEGVSQKMLTQTLRNLERDGLVVRKVLAQRPIAVTYTLTCQARELAPIVRSLKAWAERHLRVVARTNVRFDDAQGAL